MPGDRLRRGEGALMVLHGRLHPFQIAGIVDMTHEVDVIQLYADGITMGNGIVHKGGHSRFARTPTGLRDMA